MAIYLSPSGIYFLYVGEREFILTPLQLGDFFHLPPVRMFDAFGQVR